MPGSRSESGLSVQLTSSGDVIRYLLERGCLTPHAVVHDRVRVLDASRRNRNLRVERASGHGFFLKIAVDDDTRETLAWEAAVYQRLPALVGRDLTESLLVPLIVADAASSVLVFELLADAETLSDLHRRRGVFLPKWGKRLGRTLGLMHRSVASNGWPEAVGRRFRPLAFYLPEPALEFVCTCSAANRLLIRIVQEDRALCTALAHLEQVWRTTVLNAPVLIHGDLRFDNCCTVRRSRRMRIVDWELAAPGDPFWDTGSVFAEYLSAWLLSMSMPSGYGPDRYVRFAAISEASLRGAAQVFWAEYVEARALERRAAFEGLQRSIAYAAARLIQLAFEQLKHHSTLTMHALSHVQLAANLLARPVAAAVHVFGIPA